MKASGHRCTLRLRRNSVDSEAYVRHLCFSQIYRLIDKVRIVIKNENRENSNCNRSR